MYISLFSFHGWFPLEFGFTVLGWKIVPRKIAPHPNPNLRKNLLGGNHPGEILWGEG